LDTDSIEAQTDHTKASKNGNLLGSLVNHLENLNRQRGPLKEWFPKCGVLQEWHGTFWEIYILKLNLYEFSKCNNILKTL
jgi:hypothetical protein